MFAGLNQHSQARQSRPSESPRAGFGSTWRRAAVIGFFVAGALASLVWSFAPSGRPDNLQRFGDLAAAAYSTRPASLNVSLSEASQLISRSLSSTVAFRDPAGSGYEVIGSRVIDDGGIAQVQLV